MKKKELNDEREIERKINERKKHKLFVQIFCLFLDEMKKNQKKMNDVVVALDLVHMLLVFST